MRADLSLLNPAVFLGLTVVWPELAHIPGSSIVFWGVLVNTFLVVYSLQSYTVYRPFKRHYSRVKQRLLQIPTVNKIVDLLIGDLSN
jgi:hypothetical protein